MHWLQPRLHLKVSQKQILTPGLVQMVSVLALNRLELREMINQEMVENPVLEEVGDDGLASESYTEETFVKAETEKVPETEAANPFDEFDFGSFFSQYLDSGGEFTHHEHEEIERPSFDRFLSSPQSLAAHLDWQLRVSICSETVREVEEALLRKYADPNQVGVEPGKTGELIWQFTRAGTFDFACLVPGHFEAGMVGKVRVSR